MDLTARINPGKLSRAMKSADSYAENRRPGSAGPNGRRVNGRPDDLAALELSEEDTVDVEKKGAAGYAGKIWKPKFALRNHLDTVRAVAWHPTELVLFSAGEDSVAKMWDLRQYGNLKGRRPPTDIEPTYTFRGHTAAVTSLAVSFSGGRTVVYTGGADSTVRAWLAPFGEGGRVRESYASYFDTKTKLHTFVGHSNAVWDVKPHPIPHQYSLLASASADGTVKLWSLPDASGAGGYKLKATIRPPSVKVAPTSLDWCPYDLTKIVVGYTDATARVVDVTKVGQDGDGEVLRFSRPDGSDGTPSSQINRLVAHPTTAVCVAGYEDRYLRFLDMTSGSYAHQMVAHLDGVAAVDIHPSGLTVASGGHDYSIRFWDMNTRVCSQEISAHRRKYDEGVWSVAYRPSVYSGWFASGGADAIAKVYTLDA
ncbi:WD40 repeat-like protein [Gonapodya prolifera JEL478]|uniref:WD40 repeat-like protein n=1 Tax=Gonapodya prolifera (strain JEL478) TaxID=1344416 RepID=A0A139B0L5_GONPJ|nr:WD40 repeat-like protein [Gonapodya prolifera JEL478]|eukprot:KXS22507.1 WD40 repeat-like protein [Gonapodya prolifera JEL478]